MVIELTMDDLNVDAIGGFDRVMPGGFHGTIVAMTEDGGPKGEMTVDSEILRGTVANQEGKVHREFFSLNMNAPARKKIAALAIATGLVTKDQLVKDKADGVSRPLDFTQIIGKQICFNLEANEHLGKTYIRTRWDEIYHPTDKRANHIPLHVAMLAKAGIVLPPGRNPDGAVSTAKPAANTAKPAATPTASPAQAANVEALLEGV